MKYKCTKCGFLHEGEMPDGYFCPLCYTNLYDFKLISEEIKEYNRVYVSEDNKCIHRIEEKCINCGACANTCKNIVGINYKEEDKPICINCGQCILTCPTGAMCPKYDYQTVWELINIPDKIVAVMTSPAVRVAIGDAFDFAPGEFLEGKMVASLKALGFDYVFDTSFGADLTAIEEAAELANRIQNNGPLPLYTSCCPSWVSYVENYHPEILDNLSSCKSPIGMEASVLKEIFAKEEKINPDDLIIVALTPCTSKKEEIIDTPCDYVITTSELALLLREQSINFKKLTDLKFDSITGSSSGTLFGTSGGVTRSAMRVLYHSETGKHLPEDLLVIRNKSFYKEYSVKINKSLIKCAVVNKMENLEKLLPISNEFVFIEVMNCQGGCIGGGGQIIMPVKDMPEILTKRAAGLISKDRRTKNKHPYKNEEIIDLYDDYLQKPLSKKSEALLHKK